MPNGNPEITSGEWTKIKAFFGKISSTLSGFAARHNLAVDEYYHITKRQRGPFVFDIPKVVARLFTLSG